MLKKMKQPLSSNNLKQQKNSIFNIYIQYYVYAS